MASTFSPNINLEEPARGDDVGTWDTPVNANMTLLDLVCGGLATISLNNSNVTLSAGQFQSRTITFNSTLTGSVQITFPTSFKKDYVVSNVCTGSSAFTITLKTTASGQVVCCPPGDTIQVLNDGTNLKFMNMDRIGGYWDYAGSSVPSWVSGCTVPPYLLCDGSSFSGTTYPALAVQIPGLVLPDTRGRFRANINAGTARITSSVSIDGNTIFSGGGDQNSQQHSHVLTDPGHTHSTPPRSLETGGHQYGGGGSGVDTAGTSGSATTGITMATFGTGNNGNIPPVYIGGITMIRAA